MTRFDYSYILTTLDLQASDMDEYKFGDAEFYAFRLVDSDRPEVQSISLELNSIQSNTRSSQRRQFQRFYPDNTDLNPPWLTVLHFLLKKLQLALFSYNFQDWASASFWCCKTLRHSTSRERWNDQRSSVSWLQFEWSVDWRVNTPQRYENCCKVSIWEKKPLRVWQMMNFFPTIVSRHRLRAWQEWFNLILPVFVLTFT